MGSEVVDCRRKLADEPDQRDCQTDQQKSVRIVAECIEKVAQPVLLLSAHVQYQADRAGLEDEQDQSQEQGDELVYKKGGNLIFKNDLHRQEVLKQSEKKEDQVGAHSGGVALEERFSGQPFQIFGSLSHIA